MPIQDLEDQPQLTNGLIELHDIFPVIKPKLTLPIFITYDKINSFQTKAHHHTANNQITEFKMPYTTCKNPTIRTKCHTIHKGI